MVFKATELSGDKIYARPLLATDFEPLYQVAKDPKIWEQHPNPDRYKKEVFENFFKGAMESERALLVTERTSGEIIGCTRYYFEEENPEVVFIGYTFLSKSYWGKGYNTELKLLMLRRAFSYYREVQLHVGASNKRSQIAVERLGAVKIEEKEMQYYGETSKLNYVYAIQRKQYHHLFKENPFLRIEEVPHLHFSGRKKMVSLADNNITELWKEFMTTLGKYNLIKSQDYYSIQNYQENLHMLNSESQFELIAAIKENDQSKTIPDLGSYETQAGKYAVFLHSGMHQDFFKTHSFIMEQWLPSSKFTLSHRPHFQHMFPDYNVNDPQAEEEIFIPVMERN